MSVGTACSLPSSLSMDISVVSMSLLLLNSAAMNIEVHVSFPIMFFSRDMPRSEIARSYGSSIFRAKKKKKSLFYLAFNYLLLLLQPFIPAHTPIACALVTMNSRYFMCHSLCLEEPPLNLYFFLMFVDFTALYLSCSTWIFDLHYDMQGL